MRDSASKCVCTRFEWRWFHVWLVIFVQKEHTLCEENPTGSVCKQRSCVSRLFKHALETRFTLQWQENTALHVFLHLVIIKNDCGRVNSLNVILGSVCLAQDRDVISYRAKCLSTSGVNISQLLCCPAASPSTEPDWLYSVDTLIDLGIHDGSALNYVDPSTPQTSQLWLYFHNYSKKVYLPLNYNVYIHIKVKNVSKCRPI